MKLSNRAFAGVLKESKLQPSGFSGFRLSPSLPAGSGNSFAALTIPNAKKSKVSGHSWLEKALIFYENKRIII